MRNLEGEGKGGGGGRGNDTVVCSMVQLSASPCLGLCMTTHTQCEFQCNEGGRRKEGKEEGEWRGKEEGEGVIIGLGFGFYPTICSVSLEPYNNVQ